MFDFSDLFDRRDPFAGFVADIPQIHPDQAKAIAQFEQQATASLLGRTPLEISEALQEPKAHAALSRTALSAIEERAVLVDAFEVYRVTCSTAGLMLASRDAVTADAGWTGIAAGRAVDACVVEEERRHAGNEPVSAPLDDHLASLHVVLEIPRTRLRYALTRLNSLPHEQRLPIIRIFLQGAAIGEVVVSTGMSMQELTAHMKSGLLSLKLDRVHESDQ